MAPALSAAEMESLLLSELESGGGAELERDLLQAVKSMEGEGLLPTELLLDVTEPEKLSEAQARLERRCRRLESRLRLQQARAIGRRAAEEVAGQLRNRAPTRQAVRAYLRRLEREAALPRAGVLPQAPPSRSDNGLRAVAGALKLQLSLVERRLDPDATDESSGAESADETQQYNNPQQLRLSPTKRALWKWSQERASIASRWSWLMAQIQDLDYKIRQHAELQRRLHLSKGVPVCEPSGYSGSLPGQSTDGDGSDTCVRIRPFNNANFRKRKLMQMHNLHTAADKAARPSTVRCICQWPLGGCAVCTGRVLPMHPLPCSSTLTKKERLALVDPAYHPVLSTEKEVSASVQYSATLKNPQWQLRGSKNSAMKNYKNATPVINKISQVPTKMLIVNNKSHSKKKKRNKSKKGRPLSMPMELTKALQARRRTSLQDGEHVPLPSGNSSPVPSPSDHRHRPRERTDRSRLNSSYDIDNIVIPHSIAANTKLEILPYKEIPTPEWRILEIEPLETPNNGIIKKFIYEEEEEDISEATIMARHDRYEALEKGKYLQKRKISRRQQSRSGTNTNQTVTPSETPPHTPANQIDDSSNSEMPTINIQSTSSALTITSPVLPTPLHESILANIQSQSASISHKRRSTLQSEEIEIIPPYSPRDFPLNDEMYAKMLEESEVPPTPIESEIQQLHHSAAPCNNGSDSETNSGPTFFIQDEAIAVGPEDSVIDQPSDSEGDSGSVPPDEDPNDPEWNVAAHAD